MDFEKATAAIQSWLETTDRRNAFKKLEREIISTGVCTECGACVEICPVDALTGSWTDERYVPKLTGKCIACGMCYAVCPRTFVFPERLVGNYIEAWKARSLIHEEGQNGGVVSSLLKYALTTREVERVVCGSSMTDIPWKPRAVCTANPKAIPTGTVYSHAPVIGCVIRELRTGVSKIAVTGTSCAIDSLSNLERGVSDFDTQDGFHIIKLGLFCMESFSHSGLKWFLQNEGIEISSVVKMEISKGKFRVLLADEQKEWPVAKLDSVAATSCEFCRDLTCVNADISFGNIGSDDSLTTVLVRTSAGKKLFDAAVQGKAIKAEPLNEKECLTIERIAKLKAMRCYNH